MNALLGEMYLTQGDLTRAADHFLPIIRNSTADPVRYQLDDAFAYGNWSGIFANIDIREHIYSMWFNKTNFQQNGFQNLFLPIAPYQYMLNLLAVLFSNGKRAGRLKEYQKMNKILPAPK